MNQLVYAIAAMFVLVWITALRMLILRIDAVKSKSITLDYFKTMSAGNPPEKLRAAERHFVNLFEVPVLFYAACVVALALKFENQNFVILAWAFVALRYLQALIHMSSNVVRYRMYSFMAGMIALTAMWVTLVLGITGQ